MKYSFFTAILLTFLAHPITAQVAASDSVPVRVSYFNAEEKNNKTRLNWKVVCFLQYANFEVQRSSNGSDYTTITSFTADRLRCQSPFDFDDVISPVKTYYRLKVGDKDGKYSTSKVVVAFGRVKSFEINDITPNVVTSTTLLSISSAQNDKIDLAVFNSNGLLVKQQIATLSKGVTNITLDLNTLPKGLYIIKIANSSHEVRTTRIVKM